MHDFLFKNAESLDMNQLAKYASNLGLDGEALEACVKSGRYRKSIDADAALGRRAGVHGTPTFFVNGKRLVGGQTYDMLKKAVDEALAGFCTNVEVILHGDGSAEVRDNGRGIPVDTERKTKLSGVELVMTRLHAGGKFGGGSYTASGGLHGVGASVVNALSARLDVEVDRGGHTWAASFRRGVTGEFAEPGRPDAAAVVRRLPRRAERGRRAGRAHVRRPARRVDRRRFRSRRPSRDFLVTPVRVADQARQTGGAVRCEKY